VVELERIGDSVLVVGDQTTLKVHVHTDEPDEATGLFADDGAVSHLDVADMREQVRARDERLAGSQLTSLCGALAVTTGPGMYGLFESLGASALDGGPTANPSTYELLAAIHAIPAEQVVVLPNSPNVFMAAERAAALSDRIVVVVPSRSPQAGLAAAVSLDAERSAEDNARSMGETLERVRTGAVAPAARDDVQGRFRSGDALGFVEEEMVVWGDPVKALREVLERLAVDAELITCLRGADAPLDDQEVYGVLRNGVELELSEGGQRNYWWLLSAE
jgi:dihydroxyacetone kinase-like predicted kinase